jgi:hypothetical protein
VDYPGRGQLVTHHHVKQEWPRRPRCACRRDRDHTAFQVTAGAPAPGRREYLPHGGEWLPSDIVSGDEEDIDVAATRYPAAERSRSMQISSRESPSAGCGNIVSQPSAVAEQATRNNGMRGVHVVATVAP